MGARDSPTEDTTVRIFELPDLHFDKRWADVLDRCIASVEREAIENPPDLIAIPGDLHNRPLYAADRSGYRQLLDLVRRLLAIAPVVAIEGTPSHDAPGAYAPLEELGLVLLRPGMTYGYWKTPNKKDLGPSCVEASPKPGTFPTAILFGIPEIDKDCAAALGSEARAGETLQAWNQYIDEFLAPSRAAFPDVPAVALLHGVVSDATKEHETDIIKRSSSLLLHTEDLARSGIDRWVLGDIHTPWESKRISAGYAGFPGMDDNPWGKTGFVPAFNVTDIQGQYTPTVRRVPYGTPKRLKIAQPLPSYDPNVAYWLDSTTDDPKLDPAKNGAHQWSRITFQPKKEETRRVTKEEAEKAAGLGDLLALMVPDEATPERRALADSIDAGKATLRHERAIQLERVEVAGAVFFREQTVRLDVSALPAGLTAITGDNGAGKSSLLAFCSPYPVVIGKDTESGRVSAIKEFFTAKDSHIEKLITVNGVEHRHLITIKGAHTKSPKVEAYLYIGGVNVLETTNFDAMLARCEEEYGPLDDYLRTYQYVQPQQGGAPSGLMSAGTTDLRNVVQNIAGIDRETEKRAALDKAATLTGDVITAETRLQTLEGLAPDAGPLRRELSEARQKLPEIERGIDSALEDADIARQAVKAAENDLQKVEEQNAQAGEYRRKVGEEEAKLVEIDRRIEKLEELDPTDAALRLEEHRSAEKALEEWSHAGVLAKQRNAEAEGRYVRAKGEYERSLRDEEERRREHEAAVLTYEETAQKAKDSAEWSKKEAASLRELGEALANPCENCGHVSKENQEKRETKNAQADVLIQKADDALKIADNLKAPAKFIPADMPTAPQVPELEDEPKRPNVTTLQAGEVQYLLSQIEEATRAEAIIPELKERRKETAARLDDLRRNAVDFTDPESFRIEIAKRKTVAAAKDDTWKGWIREKERLIARADELGRMIERAESMEKELEELRGSIGATKKEHEDWKWLAAMLVPAKLPAFELELVLDSIDERATKNLEPFREGRYRLRTETQREGSAGRVDKFAIQVYDAEEGGERSFLKHSPGEKAFVALAYQRALIAEREERSGVTYSPHVLDEADGPVQPARVSEFYALQTVTVGDGRALIVSHAPDAQHYIGHTVALEELKS